MNDNQFCVVKNPQDEEVRPIVEGVLNYGINAIDGLKPKQLAVLLKSPSGDTLGGSVGHEIRCYFYLSHLWVSEEYRNSGFGSALLAAVEKEAITAGCKEIRLDTLNALSIPFYERNGYEIYACIPEYIPGFQKTFLRKQAKI